MVDIKTGQLTNGLDHEISSAQRVRGVDLVDAVSRDVYPKISREADQNRVLRPGIDVQQDYRVRSLTGSSAELTFVPLACFHHTPGIASKNQDIERALRRRGDKPAEVAMPFADVRLDLQVREDPRAHYEYDQHEQPDQAVLQPAARARVTAFGRDF